VTVDWIGDKNVKFHEEWTISIHPSSEDLEVKDRSQNADSFSLVDAEREIKTF